MIKGERVENQEELYALVSFLSEKNPEDIENHLVAAYGLVCEYMNKPDIDAYQRTVLLRAFFNCPYYDGDGNYMELSATSGALDGCLTADQGRGIYKSMMFVGLVREHLSEIAGWLTSYIENQRSVKPKGLGKIQKKLDEILKEGRRNELSVPKLIKLSRRVLIEY